MRTLNARSGNLQLILDCAFFRKRNFTYQVAVNGEMILATTETRTRIIANKDTIRLRNFDNNTLAVPLPSKYPSTDNNNCC